MLLGCIGDDFTGSSDLANTLAKGGMRTVQYNGVPRADADRSVGAGVVALKTRTIPAPEAVKQSLAALEWLRRQGCRQYLFKYCSTFDSTDAGNIGPVADALLDGSVRSANDRFQNLAGLRTGPTEQAMFGEQADEGNSTEAGASEKFRWLKTFWALARN